MATVELTTTVDVPRERMFDLARSVECPVETMAGHGEAAVDGVTTGLLETGDRVTWRARHVGLAMELTAAVTALDRPHHFRDEQVDGPFDELVHDHRFEAVEAGTLMHDTLRFRSPLGPLGSVADAVVLDRYLRRLLARRNRRLAAVAEGGDWERFVEG